MAKPSERYRELASKLEEAVIALGRLMYEEDGDETSMILTEFVCIGAWAIPDDEDGNERHRYTRMMSNDTMPSHHLLGLLHFGISGAEMKGEWGD